MDGVTEGGDINKFFFLGGGGHKNFISLNSQVWTKKIRCSLQNSTKSEGKIKKKSLHLINYSNFDEFLGETRKTNDLYCKIYEKIVLVHEF